MDKQIKSEIKEREKLINAVIVLENNNYLTNRQSYTMINRILANSYFNIEMIKYGGNKRCKI